MRSAQARAFPVLLGAGVLLVAINLRPAAASVGPLLGRIEADTGLSSGWAGALTTLPVLCFGVMAPLAPVLARHLGVRRSLAGAMAVLLVGMLVRLIPGVGFLFLGTAVAGTAIATGNVLLPVLVRRDFPSKTGTAMALYTFSLIGFAALSAGLAVPVADALGGGWRPGLAVWAIPAAICTLAWLPALRRRGPALQAKPQPGPIGDRVRNSGPSSIRALMRKRLAWEVTLFFTVQSGSFYATLAWLPSIFESHGASAAHAGLLLSLSLVVGLATALTVPGIAARARDQRPLVIGACVLTAAGLGGILIAPMSASYLWVVILGLGQNAAFPLALMLIVLRGGDVATTESLSTLSQSVGYGLAAFAPLAVGTLHGVTGSWTSSLILLLALVVPELAVGLAAGRNIKLSAPSSGGQAQPRVMAGDRA